jgi:hypothetical protein
MSLPPTTPPPDPESTGLPLFSSWPRVYTLVLAFFILCVAFLLWLTRAFS